MSPTSAHTAPTDVQPAPTVMQILAADEASESRVIRWSMGLAVVVHAVLFVTNWGFLAFGGDEPVTAPNKQRLYVVQVVKFEQPPAVDRTTIKRPTKPVPIPDPTPDDPEPVREINLVEAADMPLGDVVFDPPEQPPAVEEHSGPYPVGGKVSAPVRVGGLDPVYPKAALAANQQGTVVLSCIIGRDGRVKSITPLLRLGFGLTEAAIAAVESWVFEPSTLNGEAVEVEYNLSVHFRTNR
jgi:periplasmic protein TonB